jgi:hypothetical protein
LNATYLKYVMHQKHYAEFVEKLVRGGAVLREPYQIGRQSYGFTLSQRFIKDSHIRVPVKDSRLENRLKQCHEKAEANGISRPYEACPSGTRKTSA